MFQFRPITEADFEATAELWHKAWHDGHAPLMPDHVVAERTLERFAVRLPGLAAATEVAVDDEGIAGFSSVVAPEVDQFFVARRARGTGLAAELLKRAEARLAGAGVARGEIQCIAGNRRAFAFYLKWGWQDQGVRQSPLWTSDGREELAPTHVLTKLLEQTR